MLRISEFYSYKKGKKKRKKKKRKKRKEKKEKKNEKKKIIWQRIILLAHLQILFNKQITASFPNNDTYF